MKDLITEKYTIKADNPYQFTNGAIAVLGEYLKDKKLGSKEKRMISNMIKDLTYLRKYFYSRGE